MGDLFVYPFLSGVWGTVSDWTIVLVTGFTFLFLYKTFKAQLKVAELTLKLTRIENSRFIKEFQPVFIVDFISVRQTFLRGVRTMKFKCIVRVEKNSAKDVHINISAGSLPFESNPCKPHHINNFHIENVYTIDLTFEISSEQFNSGFEVDILIWAVDMADNTYNHLTTAYINMGIVRLFRDIQPSVTT